MSTFLHIDGVVLQSREITTRRRRGQAEEIQALTPATRLIWINLNYALHKKKGPGNPREGIISFAGIAKLAGVCRDTVIVAIRVLEEVGLILRRRLIDPRGIAGKFFGPNLYRLLTPPSLRTPEEERQIEDLRRKWREDERLEVPWHQHRHEIAEIGSPLDASPTAPKEKPEHRPGNEPESKHQDKHKAKIHGTEAGRLLISAFYHACLGVDRVPSAREAALADELIEQYGAQATQIVDWVAKKIGARARSFGIVPRMAKAAIYAISKGGSDRPVRSTPPDRAVARKTEDAFFDQRTAAERVRWERYDQTISQVRRCAQLLQAVERFVTTPACPDHDRLPINTALRQVQTILGPSLEYLVHIDKPNAHLDASLEYYASRLENYRINDALDMLIKLDKLRRAEV